MNSLNAENQKDTETPHYGYYALTIFVVLAALIFIAGAVILFVSKVVGAILIAFGFYIVLSYIISLYSFKQSEFFDISDILNLTGNEQALDVGCGLGKVTIGVAKHVPEGKVTGIDIWDTVEIPGNSPEAAYRNAEIEGVQNGVEFLSGDVLNLEFEDNSFDLVTSSSVLNNLNGNEKKLRALREIYRVLKPGGTFFLLEPLRNLRGFFIFTPFAFWKLLPKDKWIELLEKAGFVNLEYQYRGEGYFVVEKSQ